MDDAQRKLLEDRKTIILPDEIDHDAYSLVVEAAILYPDDEIDLYCRGEGGYSGDAFAMIDIIQQHRKFVGLLVGAVVSSHAVIWAACNTRYVYPHGKLGLHGVITTHERTDFMNAKAFFQKARANERIDYESARLFASISNNDIEHWRLLIENTGLGLEWLYSEQIIEYHMAHTIADRKWVNGDKIARGLMSNDVHTTNEKPVVVGDTSEAGEVAGRSLKMELESMIVRNG